MATVTPNKSRPTCDHNPHRRFLEANWNPPPSAGIGSTDDGRGGNRCRVPGNSGAAKEGKGCGRGGRMVVGVEEEKGGGDDCPNEDEEEALLAEKIGGCGTGKGGASVVLLCVFYGESPSDNLSEFSTGLYPLNVFDILSAEIFDKIFTLEFPADKTPVIQI
ncbi:hypothetical protein M5K25_007297 [Dendrobium thyrsiflorum]|uniref:Uncharacterized protein n=1 Tax=Dendrobium thyrsiflorum TaxID=117978 RepID=A0ABD0VL68_DENTH